MPRRTRYRKRKRGRRGRKRRLFRRRRRGGGKYGYKGHQALKMLGSVSFFPRRQVVKGVIQSDWLGIGGGAGAFTNYTLMANTCLAPLLPVTGELNSYQGLQALMSSVSTNRSSIYQYYRILHVKLTMEVMCTNPTAAAPGLEFGLYPHSVVSPVAATANEAGNRQYAKTSQCWLGASRPSRVTVSMSPRKFQGLTKATYGQDEYYGASANDPVNKIYNVVWYQSVPAGVLAGGTYAWRFRQVAMIELSEPYDTNMLLPT